jgi:hypothetical protein
MQTTGATLLAVEPCCVARMLTTVQEGRSASGLLYLVAVSADWREQEHRQEAVDTDPSFVSYRQGVGYRRLPENLASRVTRLIGECRMSLWSAVVVSPSIAESCGWLLRRSFQAWVNLRKAAVTNASNARILS